MYIGVKYIGGNETREDTICNTGAVWAQGEVLNFEEESAKKLAVHTDSFLLVDMSSTAKTYSNKQINTVDNYEPFPSLASMDAEQIAALASVRYGIKIDIEGREKDDVVFDALNRIKAANLRADATELGVNVLPVISLTVTDEEYKRYIAQELVLVLVPKREPDDVLLPLEAMSEKLVTAEVVPDVLPEPVSFVEASPLAIVTPAPIETLPTLPELLAQLGKKGLMTLAKENNVPVANTMSVEKLRDKLIVALRDKA